MSSFITSLPSLQVYRGSFFVLFRSKVESCLCNLRSISVLDSYRAFDQYWFQLGPSVVLK